MTTKSIVSPPTDLRVGSTDLISAVGVVGGGTMGRGIAINFLNAGVPVVLLETSEESADAATHGIRAIFDTAIAKGKLDEATGDRRMQLLTATSELRALGDCDLVIEAVYEDIELKRSVCRQLGAVCKAGAIIATNTSTLDVDDLALTSGRPAEFLGLHFFSPAHVMQLLEVVRGKATSSRVLAVMLDIARKIRKVPVVSGTGWGFIGNRMLEPYLREAEFLLLEGATPAQIDRAIETFGMAMGPCRLMDMAGIDVGANIVEAGITAGVLPSDSRYRAVSRKLATLKRYGQKAGVGCYRYQEREAMPDEDFDDIVNALAKELGISQRKEIASSEIAERLLFSLINEGTRVLEEGIAYDAADIDTVWTTGYGFPKTSGGPMQYAHSVGWGHIAARMTHYAQTRGNPSGYWTPSNLLITLAETGGDFQNLPNQS